MFAILLSAFLALLAPGAPELSDRSFAEIRDHVRPSEAERRWQEIPWRTTFWSAVTEAQRAERPLLIWAMNGHPLACT